MPLKIDFIFKFYKANILTNFTKGMDIETLHKFHQI